MKQFRIFALIFRFGFVKQEFSQHALVWRVQNIVPFGQIPAGKRVNDVDVSEPFK